MLSVRSTSSHSSPSRSESPRDEMISALQIHDNQESASTNATFLESVGVLSSKECPPANFSAMLDIHNKFSSLEKIHLKNIAQLRKFPNDTSDANVAELKQWNIKSIEDVNALWDIVVRISTVTVSAKIRNALQPNNSQSSLEPTFDVIRNFKNSYTYLAGSDCKSEFSKNDIDAKIASLTHLLNEFEKLEQNPSSVGNVNVEEQLAGAIAKTIGPVDYDKVHKVAQSVLQTYNLPTQ